MYVLRITEARSENHFCRGKAVSRTYFCVCVCVCKCGCACSGVFWSACSLTNLACNSPPYCHLRLLWLHRTFRLFLINCTIFGKKLLSTKCVFWFSLQYLLKTFFILRTIHQDSVINVKSLLVKYLLFFSDFRETRISSTDFSENKKLK